MDPGFAIGIGVLWFVLSLLGKRKTTSDPTRRPSAPRLPPQSPVTLPRSTGADPTQREGVRLQDLLRELGRTLDQAAGPQGRRSPVRLPPAEEVEERASLESMPEAQSLEGEVTRPERKIVDADDEAAAIAARRIAAVEANARPMADADHRAFDARIRQQPADATGTKGVSNRRLREAVVWREILGPPIALRDDDDR